MIVFACLTGPQIVGSSQDYSLFYYNIFSLLIAYNHLSMDRLDKIKSRIALPDHPGYLKMKYILTAGLFSLEPTFPKITKSHLALLSTPGVADVCLRIKENPTEVDGLTIRGRSIALVSRGQMLNTEGRSFLPVMDWMIAQIKFYSNIDSYPFVIRPDCSLAEVLSDLSNTFCGALILDNEDIPQISHINRQNLPFFTLSHYKVCTLLDLELTNAETSANILTHLIRNKYNGELL